MSSLIGGDGRGALARGDLTPKKPQTKKVGVARTLARAQQYMRLSQPHTPQYTREAERQNGFERGSNALLTKAAQTVRRSRTPAATQK